MSYDINVLVNGNRCKQYLHNGHTFIEAKEGSEYVVEIKNNSWERVLAVISVDGLNILDGESAEADGAGYIIDKYSSQKFHGYQYSKEKVATFKFGTLGAFKNDPDTGEKIMLGYASSKKDGSEKNVGVIGVKIWNEVEPPPPLNRAPSLFGTASWSSYIVSSSYCTTGAYHGGWYGEGRYGYTENVPDVLSQKLCSTTGYSNINISSDTYTCETTTPPPVVPSFNMETQWGESRTHKIREATFERKELIYSFDIYYTSRSSLLEIGIDLGTEKRANWPESFKPIRFAKPPKGWKE